MVAYSDDATGCERRIQIIEGAFHRQPVLVDFKSHKESIEIKVAAASRRIPCRSAPGLGPTGLGSTGPGDHRQPETAVPDAVAGSVPEATRRAPVRRRGVPGTAPHHAGGGILVRRGIEGILKRHLRSSRERLRGCRPEILLPRRLGRLDVVGPLVVSVLNSAFRNSSVSEECFTIPFPQHKLPRAKTP